MEQRKKKRASGKREDPPVMDERFAHAMNDPVFRRVPKKEKRVDIDKRFQSMFHDKKFKLKYTVDKRGRPIDLTSNEDLRQYYNLVDDDEEEGDVKDSKEGVKKAEDVIESSEPEESDDEIFGNVTEAEIGKHDPAAPKLSKTLKKKLHDSAFDYARGDGFLVAEESSDGSSSSADEEEEIDNTHAWGEMDHDAERTNEATSRLALCNMDWDRLKAVDLMVLFHSFLPTGGVLKSVKIYTSEYGKQRLADEDVHGPMELRKVKEEADSSDDSDSDVTLENDAPVGFLNNEDEDEEGGGYHMEKLRQYQLNRLKYYYAVLECDSVVTAEKLYAECDGMEYESSATRIDLRYIPEDMEFENEPNDCCDALPQADKYRPRFFTTTALQQAKVNLTWDETDPLRKELTQKIHNPKEKIEDEDLKAYLASSSSSEDEDEQGDGESGSNVDALGKYRALLESIETQEKKKKDKDVEMEITWGVGLKEKTESLVKKKLEEETAATLTPWEQILEKKKEKRKQKKKQLKGKNEDDEGNADLVEGQLFSDDEVDVDLNDPFFRDEIESNELMKPKTITAKEGKQAKVKAEKHAEALAKTEENAALELLLMDDGSDSKNHFSLKKIMQAENEGKGKKKKKKGKKKAEKAPNQEVDTFQVDVEDQRFSALFSSHLYNVDPSDPNFKKTKGMEAIIQEKQKRRTVNGQDTEDKKLIDNDHSAPKISKKSELSYLVKSVKRNASILKKKSNKTKQ